MREQARRTLKLLEREDVGMTIGALARDADGKPVAPAAREAREFSPEGAMVHEHALAEVTPALRQKLRVPRGVTLSTWWNRRAKMLGVTGAGIVVLDALKELAG